MAAVRVQELLERMGAATDALTVGRAFGEAYTSGGATIVPVAAVRVGGGGGFGAAGVPGRARAGAGTPITHDGDGAAQEVPGGGGGFGGVIRPLGVFVIRDDDVRWQPVVDVQRTILGGQLLGLAAILVLRRLLRRRR